MNLIIKEYLSLLKESKELDSLLPDLLLTMNFTIISKPQVGVRQHGVDLSAFGKDEDGVEKFFLFVIKQGDITRSNWNGNEDATRASLDDIIDVYIPKMIPVKYKNNIIKIILCTGGDLNQAIEINWNSYVEKNKSKNIEFDFWGGDKLSLLIFHNMFNENIFSEKNKSLLRRSLSLLSEPSYDMKDFYQILHNLLESKSKMNVKSQLKLFRTIHLMLNILFYWATYEKNLKPAILAGERTLLNCWKFICDNKLEKNKKIIVAYYNIYISCNRIFNTFISKFSNLYKIKNGLSGLTHSGDSRIETIMLFEHLGILSTGALINLNTYQLSKNESFLDSAKTIVTYICNFLNNHPCLYNPLYDEQIIDINITMYVLAKFGKTQEIINYIENLFYHLVFAYNSGFDYFVCTNSFDDILVENKENRKESTKASTLLFWIGFWISLLNDEELYKNYCEIISSKFSHTAIQFWYPDKNTENYLYSNNAGHFSGFSSVILKLPEKQDELQKIISNKPKELLQINEFSCVKKGFFSLIFLSNRHFRTPFISEFIIKYDDITTEEQQ